MSNFQEIAENYVRVWNIEEPASRLAAVGVLFNPAATYSDPLAQVNGSEAIAATIGAVQAQLPNMKMSLEGEVDGHGEQLRLSWVLGPEAGEAPVAGFDVLVLRDGKIDAVWGFIDRMPAAA